MKSLAHCVGRGLTFLTIAALVVGFWAVNVTYPAAAQAQETKYEGYLADALCAGRGTALDGADMKKHPEKHSVACLKEPPCVASGFGVLTKGKDDNYTFHKFDKKGDELALELIKKTKKTDHLSVDVAGRLENGVLNVQSITEK
ncbi:MAG TPA: hypothetical protein VMC85_23575 [Desulfomonilaceae bacterium]|nr:hypothetical protein [Desulfomonilaceae bacterium]